MSVEFQDFSIQVTEAIEDAAIRFLEEASNEIKSQAEQNSRVKTGQLKGSWRREIDNGEKKATVGSGLENAIWEEFGTGEYAVNGDGRQGGWRYQDDNGDWHYTTGKKPNRTLQRAFESKKNAIINRAKQIFGGLN